jgi:hypothetical protein
MALNLDKMRSKLSALTSNGDDSRKNFWKPPEGQSSIRIVPTADGDPFKEKFFHYSIANSSFLCPKRNFGDNCPACEFASQLWNEGTEESKKMAKNFFAKQRFFTPVLVRGEEAEGVRVWGFGKMAYEKLLTIVLDPDYGDITDAEAGNDLRITYGKPAGASFPRTDISPRPRKTVLCDDAVGGDERCAELLETLPDLDSLFERKTTEDVRATLAQHINDPDNSSETEKYGNAAATTTDNEVNAVDAAFRELL